MNCYLCKKPLSGPTTTLDYCTATGRKELPSFGRNFDKRYGFEVHQQCFDRKMERLAKNKAVEPSP